MPEVAAVYFPDLTGQRLQFLLSPQVPEIKKTKAGLWGVFWRHVHLLAAH